MQAGPMQLDGWGAFGKSTAEFGNAPWRVDRGTFKGMGVHLQVPTLCT